MHYSSLMASLFVHILPLQTPWTPTNIWLLPSVREGTIGFHSWVKEPGSGLRYLLAPAPISCDVNMTGRWTSLSSVMKLRASLLLLASASQPFQPYKRKVSFSFQLCCAWEPAVTETVWMKARQGESKLIAEVAFPEMLTNIPFYCSENFWAFKEGIEDRSQNWISDLLMLSSDQLRIVFEIPGSGEVKRKTKTVSGWLKLSYFGIQSGVEVNRIPAPGTRFFSQ